MTPSAKQLHLADHATLAGGNSARSYLIPFEVRGRELADKFLSGLSDPLLAPQLH